MGPSWDPHNSDWLQQEASMTDLRGQVQNFDYDVAAKGQRLINSVSCSHLQVNPTDCKEFADALERSVRVCWAKTSMGWRAIDADALAEKWMVSTKVARRTLSRTTRRGIRTTAHSSMSRRFRTNDRHMRYKRLNHSMYANTMKASVPSRSKDLYASLLTSSGQGVPDEEQE